MSSIRWHFEDDVTLCMGGRERAWMSLMIEHLTRGIAKLRAGRDNVGRYWPPFGYDDTFDTQLATVWAIGSRPVKLAVLIHGWCETNRVIEGEAFSVIADVLAEGLETGVFRPETQGYEGIERIIERLRAGGEWCVWSYSGTDGFPRLKDADADEWYTEAQTVELLRAEGNTIEADVFDCTFGGSLLKMEQGALERMVR